MSEASNNGRTPVWCLEFPAQFGRFFPQGNYIGWKEALESYFHDELTDEGRGEFDNWDASYIADVASKFSQNTNPVLEHEWPAEYRLDRDYKRLGSISDSQNGFLLVEGALKNLIEELEPGVHHFRPLNLLTRSGDVYPGDYHVMAIGQNLNGFDPEGSDADCIKWSERLQMYGVNPSGLKGMAFNRDLVAGKHFWREMGARGIYICLSDKLVQEIRARDFLMPDLIATKGYVA